MVAREAVLLMKEVGFVTWEQAAGVGSACRGSDVTQRGRLVVLGRRRGVSPSGDELDDDPL